MLIVGSGIPHMRMLSFRSCLVQREWRVVEECSPLPMLICEVQASACAAAACEQQPMQAMPAA